MFSHVDSISWDAEPRSTEPVLSVGFASGGFASVAKRKTWERFEE